MITVELYGRTGNNMFQIAAALALAKKHHTNVCYIGNNQHLNGFKLKGTFRGQNKSSSHYKESCFTYDGNFANLPDNTHLDGYFQSEKYFLNAEDEIRRCFAFDQNVVDAAKKYNGSKYKRILHGELATAIHIRRTDYLKHPDVYPQFGIDYYDNCLSKIPNKGMVLVFSDDLGWCSSAFNGRGYDVINLPPLPSMYLMSHCKNIIMANSTFSWWAAWLGKPEMAIYPRNWFGSNWPHKDKHSTQEECTKDLCPSRWISV